MANEKRLIDASSLKEVFTRYLNAPHVQCGHSVGAGMRIAIKSCIELLDNAPTVDAVEVVHGRWEQIGEADYKCPVCGFRFTSCDPIEMFEYCRCGTKMDGDRYV